MSASTASASLKPSEEVRAGQIIALPLARRGARPARRSPCPTRRGPPAEARACYDELEPANVSQEASAD